MLSLALLLFFSTSIGLHSGARRANHRRAIFPEGLDKGEKVKGGPRRATEDSVGMNDVCTRKVLHCSLEGGESGDDLDGCQSVGTNIASERLFIAVAV
jgi:hypothetical protein